MLLKRRLLRVQSLIGGNCVVEVLNHIILIILRLLSGGGRTIRLKAKAGPRDKPRDYTFDII